MTLLAWKEGVYVRMYVHTWAPTYGVLSNEAFLIARELCSTTYILYLISLKFTS